MNSTVVYNIQSVTHWDDHESVSHVGTFREFIGTDNASSNIFLSSPSVGAVEAILFAVFTSACIVFTVVGNILVILSVFTYRPLRNVANFFIVSLAVADLAVACCVMPYNVANYILGKWVLGVIFCNMWLTFDVLTCTASILNLCAIAIDRYYAIHDPICYAQKRTMRRVLLVIATVWLVSALISIPPLVGWNNSSGQSLYDETTGVCALTDEKSYVIYSALGSFYIPLIIMSFVYINIFRATRARLRQRANAAAAAKLAAATGHDGPKGTGVHAETSSTESAEDTVKTVLQGGDIPAGNSKLAPETATHVNGSHHDTHQTLHNIDSRSPLTAENDSLRTSHMHQFYEEKQRISLSKERRAARTMTVIMGVFVLCWLPFFLMYVILAFCERCKDTDTRVINFIVWLGYVNSALNPIIYTIFNLDFRRAFKRLLQGNCKLLH